MEVGDLVTLSAKAKKLQWVEKITRYKYREYPRYGVITYKHSESSYHIHWFYDNGEQRFFYCGFERSHLKRFK